MSDQGPRPPRQDDADLHLLRMAGPRAPVPRDRKARVRAAVRAHWQQRLVARRRRWLWVAVPLAAAAALTVAVLLPRIAPWRGHREVATVEVIQGHATRARDAETLVLAAGSVLPAGSIIQTGGDGRVALRLGLAGSLRLDTETSLVLVSQTLLRLTRGALYLDSQQDSSEEAVTVSTPVAEVREEGTQFEVRLAGENLRVRVREGLVKLGREREAVALAAGQQAMLAPGAELTLQQVAPNDPDWAWVLAVAPPFQLEGSSLASFLTWVTRETGLRLRWEDPGVSRRAAQVALHGEISGLRPDQAAAVVLPTCGLSHHEENGTLVVDTIGE